jgi:tetratricopeptide (TPR) repeat protein
MRTAIAWCLGALCAVAAFAQGDEVAMPTSFKLTYELVSHEQGNNKLSVSYEDGRAKLALALTDKGRAKASAVSPWDGAKALWKAVDAAKVFDFKPQEGDPTPHFGEVKLSVEATIGGEKKQVAHQWKAPLRNDGQVWGLIDHLDKIMTGTSTPQEPSKDASPASPASPAPASSPGARAPGDVEALIASASTRMPLPLDAPRPEAPSRAVADAVFAREKPLIEEAIARLSGRIAKRARASVYATRAVLWLDLGQHASALADLDRAIALEPHRAMHRHNRGAVLLSMGRASEAERDLEAAHLQAPGQFDRAGAVLAARHGRTWDGRAGRHLVRPAIELR